MSKLIWVYDSPFSRSIKWLLLNCEVPHKDHVLTWDEMTTDTLLAYNPKRQVPTILSKDNVKTDSLLIALEYLPSSWHQSLDAKLFRLADSDIEAAIIFLFRANLLSDKFGESENSQLMLKSGIDTFKMSIDYLLDHLMAQKDEFKCNFGAVLLYSTLLVAVSLSEQELKGYRQNELAYFVDVIESDSAYREMASICNGSESNKVPFESSKFNK